MIVDSAVYRDGTRLEVAGPRHDYARLRAELSAPRDFIWVGLHEPTPSELEDVARTFELHPLAVEDAVKAHQRPKIEHYDHTMFLVLKTAWYVDEDDAVETGEISIFSGRDFVITVRHGPGTALTAVRAHLARDQVLEHGPSAVVHGVCDRVVDTYAEVLTALHEDVEEVETSVFSGDRSDESQRIYFLKRETAEMRRAVLPLREAMHRFSRGEIPGIDPESGPFFRDVADHLDRAADNIETLDNLLSTAFGANLARISVQQNDDMRKISAGVGLVAAPTLVAGVYGMNFEHMPELHWLFGYPFALGLMVLISGTAYVLFKRSGWL